MALCLPSLAAFNSFQRLNIEFTNAKAGAILKFFIVEDKSSGETFLEICSTLWDGTLSLQTSKEWFTRFEAVGKVIMDKQAGGKPVTTNTEQIMKTSNRPTCGTS